MEDILGVHKSNKNLIFVVASPVGKYFSGEIRLSVVEDYWRGTPYSAAEFKLSANYAPTVLIGHELSKRGFSQALWTYNGNLLESGATNIFFVVKDNSNGGKREVVTHPVDGSILPGVTRQSVIDLSKDVFPDYICNERPFSITEFVDRFRNGELEEVFVTGTASVIQRVAEIEVRGELFNLQDRDGTYSEKMKQYISDIKHGIIEHEFAMLI